MKTIENIARHLAAPQRVVDKMQLREDANLRSCLAKFRRVHRCSHNCIGQSESPKHRQRSTPGYKELNESGEFVVPGFVKMSVISKPAMLAAASIPSLTVKSFITAFAGHIAAEAAKVAGHTGAITSRSGLPRPLQSRQSRSCRP